MTKRTLWYTVIMIAAGGLLLGAGSTLSAQESATPEIQAGTEAGAPKKAPTLKDLARVIETLRKENAALKTKLVALESRLNELERAGRPPDLERRVRALEAVGTVDVYRELGLSRSQTLETWHRDAHRSDPNVKLPTRREWEEWHERDHQLRRLYFPK